MVAHKNVHLYTQLCKLNYTLKVGISELVANLHAFIACILYIYTYTHAHKIYIYIVP